MNEIYKAPECSLDDHLLEEKRPHIFWRFFFWLNAPILVLISFSFWILDGFTVYDYVSIALEPVTLLVLFGYSYGKRILTRELWQLMAFAYPVWCVFYCVIVPFVLKIPQFGSMAEVDLWLLLDPLFILPTCICLYLYSYRSPNVWRS